MKKVLFLLKLKYNLLSVSKMTKDSNMRVVFYPSGCLFQDQENKFIAIGRLDQGLYKIDGNCFGVTKEKVQQLFKNNMTIDKQFQTLFSGNVRNFECNESDALLWHARMAHCSFNYLAHIKELNIQTLRIMFVMFVPCPNNVD